MSRVLPEAVPLVPSLGSKERRLIFRAAVRRELAVGSFEVDHGEEHDRSVVDEGCWRSSFVVLTTERAGFPYEILTMTLRQTQPA